MGARSKPFTLDLPRGWEDQTVFIFATPEIDGRRSQMMMVLDRHLRTDSIDEFTRERTVPIVGSLQGLEILKHEEITLEGGNPAWEFIYKWAIADDASIYQMYVFVIAEKVGFTFSVQLTKKSYQLLGPQIRDIIDELVPGTYEPAEDD